MTLLSYTFHDIELQVIIFNKDIAVKFDEWLISEFLLPNENYRLSSSGMGIHVYNSISFKGKPVASFSYKMDEPTDSITVCGANYNDVLLCINKFIEVHELYEINE